MAAPQPLRSPVGLTPGDHVAWAVDGVHPPAEALVPFFEEGAARRERLILVTDSEQDALAGLGRRDELVDRGQLRLQSADQTYQLVLAGDPWGQAALFRDEADRALADGFSGIRVWADMTMLAADPGRRGRLLDYETAAESIFRERPATGLCAVDVTGAEEWWTTFASRHPVRSGWSETPPLVVLLHDNVVRLVGTLDLVGVPELRDSLESVRRTTTGPLALDLEGVDFLDVAGTRAIAQFVARLAETGRTAELVGARGLAARVLGLFDLPMTRGAGA